jgi:hypothetical protein
VAEFGPVHVHVHGQGEFHIKDMYHTNALIIDKSSYFDIHIEIFFLNMSLSYNLLLLLISTHIYTYVKRPNLNLI